MQKNIIKVCGLCDAENIRQVSALGVGWIGMIFNSHSPRNVTMIPTHVGIIPDRAPTDTSVLGSIPDGVPTGAAAPLPSRGGFGGGVCNSPKRVGVFIDEMAQNIITRVVNFQLDLVQLNGHETPTLIRNLRATLDPDIRPGIKFIKAITVGSSDDIATYKTYEDCVDYFLFDICSPINGDSDTVPTSDGSGEHLDWSFLDAYDGDVPFLLGGGIGPEDAERVRAFYHPKCVGIDLASHFESAPGMMDVNILKAFITKI